MYSVTPVGWMLERHEKLHANRPQSWEIEIDGCQECLLDLIGNLASAVVVSISKQHYILHKNLLASEHYINNGRANLCSRCVDILFAIWPGLEKLLAEAP